MYLQERCAATIKRKNIVPALHGDDKMAKILFPRGAETIKRKNIVPAPRGDDKKAKILFPRGAATIKDKKIEGRILCSLPVDKAHLSLSQHRLMRPIGV